MLLFLKGEPVWLAVCYFIIPFSFFLILKGIEALVKMRSVAAFRLVGGAVVSSLLIAAYFAFFLNRPIPDWLLYFSLPFGALAFFAFDFVRENTVFGNAFVFVLGIFFNAAALGCLIEFAERAYRFNKRLENYGGQVEIDDETKR